MLWFVCYVVVFVFCTCCKLVPLCLMLLFDCMLFLLVSMFCLFCVCLLSWYCYFICLCVCLFVCLFLCVSYVVCCLFDVFGVVVCFADVCCSAICVFTLVVISVSRSFVFVWSSVVLVGVFFIVSSPCCWFRS